MYNRCREVMYHYILPTRTYAEKKVEPRHTASEIIVLHTVISLQQSALLPFHGSVLFPFLEMSSLLFLTCIFICMEE